MTFQNVCAILGGSIFIKKQGESNESYITGWHGTRMFF